MPDIPEGIPSSSLAFKWCQLGGDRSAIHHSFKRWVPEDYDKAELDDAINESLKKYPDALRAFPEKSR